MEFEVKKTENCFSDSQTYEYSIPIHNSEFLKFLKDYQIKINEKLRRPVFVAENSEGIILKGILKRNIIKASFPADRWEYFKTQFESRLFSLEAEE